MFHDGDPPRVTARHNDSSDDMTRNSDSDGHAHGNVCTSMRVVELASQ